MGANHLKKAEKKIEEIKKDFIKIIPSLKDIEDVQQTSREIQEKSIKQLYTFINTHANTTLLK